MKKILIIGAVIAALLIPTNAEASVKPSDVLNLKNWYLTLPTGRDEDPDTVYQPDLTGYEKKPYFWAGSTGVHFLANVGGATTSGSIYPRTELREMKDYGMNEASWSTTRGTHEMLWTVGILHVPPVKPQMSVGQIHGSSGDFIIVYYDGAKKALMWKRDSVIQSTPILSNVALNTWVDLKISVSSGHVKIYAQGKLRAETTKSSTGNYFKAGAYVLSNPTKGDSPNEYGEVVVKKLVIYHD